MPFHQIVIIDDTRMPAEFIQKFSELSENPIKVYEDDPESKEVVVERIGAADCIMLTWRTQVDREVLDACPNLKMIALCGTNSKLIDLAECKKRKIVVSNVRDYGDEGVVEFILYELLSLVKGWGKYKWKSHVAELSCKTIGIIGMGVVGKLLAKAALGLGMKVLYHTPRSKPEVEKLGLIYAEKKDLLQQSDFISLQTPRDVQVLTKEDFALMQGKVLINTTIGQSFRIEDFVAWIKKEGNFAIMDSCPAPELIAAVKGLERVIVANFVSCVTEEGGYRLAQKALDNLEAFLAGKPTNLVI